MDIAIPLNGNIELDKEKETEFIQRIRDDVKDIKLDLLKNILANEGIAFNPAITNYKELKKDTFKTLSKAQKKKIEYQLQKGQDEIIDVIDSIDDNSSTNLQKFLTQLYENVVSPTAKGALLAVTSKIVYSALVTLPTPIRTITGIAGFTGAIYKGSKLILKNRKKKESKICDNIFRKLETVKDEDGNILDTRFKEEERKLIKEYFSNKGKEISEKNFDIQKEIQRLNNTEKIELINIINNYKGNPLDISKELKDERKQEKINGIKSIIEGIGMGVAVGSFANSIDETLIAGPVNGFAAKIGSKNFIKDDVVNKIPIIGNIASAESIQNILGVATGVLTKGATYIPIVGEELKNAFAIESLTIGGITGATVALAGIGVKTALAGIKKAYNKIKDKLERNKYKKADKLLYGEVDNKRELTKKQQTTFSIIEKYMQEKGIYLNTQVQTAEELKNAVKQLNKSDKKELKKVIDVIEGEMTKDGELSDKAKKALEFLGNSLVIGATAVGVKEISENFRNGMKVTNTKKRPEDFIIGDQETPEIEAMSEYEMNKTTSQILPQKDIKSINETLPNETLPQPEVDTTPEIE